MMAYYGLTIPAQVFQIFEAYIMNVTKPPVRAAGWENDAHLPLLPADGSSLVIDNFRSELKGTTEPLNTWCMSNILPKGKNSKDSYAIMNINENLESINNVSLLIIQIINEEKRIHG